MLTPMVSAHAIDMTHSHQRKSASSHAKKKKPLPAVIIHTNAMMKRFSSEINADIFTVSAI